MKLRLTGESDSSRRFYRQGYFPAKFCAIPDFLQSIHLFLKFPRIVRIHEVIFDLIIALDSTTQFGVSVKRCGVCLEILLCGRLTAAP